MKSKHLLLQDTLISLIAEEEGIKFMFSKETTKLMKYSLLIWPYVVNVKSTMQILSIIMAFLENMNFKREHGAKIACKITRRWEFYKK